MRRLRFSRAEAQAEATRRAIEFVANRPDRDSLRHSMTRPDSFVPPSCASKHPLAWVAVFMPVLPADQVMDGGELLVAVDLETGRVALREVE